uniref:Uncharacterized protein n=1 Tax=Panagrolaimus davidi TaxID=227884 RepID=A0A914QE14_9BILA
MQSNQGPSTSEPQQQNQGPQTPQQLQPPQQQPSQLKTDPTQTSSQPSYASVYMEPALHNSAYAYQKEKN